MNCLIILLLLFCCGNGGECGEKACKDCDRDCNRDRCDDNRGNRDRCEDRRDRRDVCRCDDDATCRDAGCGERCDDCGCRERKGDRDCAEDCRDQKCARDDRRDGRRSEDYRRVDSDCCDNRGMRMTPWQDFSGCGRNETCGCEENNK